MRSVAASLFYFCCLQACSRSTHPAAPIPTPTPQLTDIIHATSGSITPIRTLSGFIAPLQNITLSTTLAEPAASVRVIEGDHVKAGEILAVFDVSDLQANLHALERSAAEADANTLRQQFQSSQTIGQGVGSADQAQASLRQMQAKLQEDLLDLSRDETLEARGFIARQALDQQRTTVESDKAAVASAQAALHAAQITVTTNGSPQQGLQAASIAVERAAADVARAQADQVRAQISRGTMTSPVDGIVINRNLNPNEYPNNRTLFTIAQTGNVYAIFNVSPTQVDGIRNGQSVSVQLNSEPRRRRQAHIVAVLGQSTPGSTNFTVKALIDQADDALLSGLPLTGTVILAPISGTEVPRTAFTDGTESQVLAVRNNVAHHVDVTVLAENATHAIVQGLAPGRSIAGNGTP